MKNFKPITLVVAILLTTFAFYQCTNDEGLFTPIFEADFANFDELHDTIDSDTVFLQIEDPSVETTLEGPQGIRLVFPAYTGTAPAPFDVELIEIFRRGDMIAQNIQTFADDAPLVSGGMFWYRVKDANGVELNLSGVSAILPRQTDAAGYENSMEYFLGESQTAPSGPVLSWGTGNSDLSFDEDAGTNGEYTIWSVVGGWSNCDAFYDLLTEGATQFSVNVTNANDYTNTKVFFALDNFSTVAALTTEEGDALKTYDESIPMGATGTIIAIALVDGYLQFASQQVTIAGDDTFTLEVQPGSVADLETLLSSLD